LAERVLWGNTRPRIRRLSGTPRQRRRPGTWCRPITNGSRACDRLRHRRRAGKARPEIPEADKASLEEFKQVRKALLEEGKGGGTKLVLGEGGEK